MGYYVEDWNLQTIKSFSDPLDDCCIWRGGKHKQGYGMMRYKKEMRTVHSVIAELKYGRKPTKYSGDRVTRTCDNVACCNPDHIIILDASKIQRTASSNPGTFTDDDIRDIRNQYDNHRYYGMVNDLARQWNVSPSTITSICKRRLYKRVK